MLSIRAIDYLKPKHSTSVYSDTNAGQDMRIYWGLANLWQKFSIITLLLNYYIKCRLDSIQAKQGITFLEQ